MKPFFKWSGGKSKELPVIKKYIPSNFNTYYEPFLGGGAVCLNIQHSKSIVGDTYEPLINFFITLQSNPVALLEKIKSLSNDYNEAVKKCSSKEEQQKVADIFYYPYRDNIQTNNFDKAVSFFLMRQLSFSGMLRFSGDGKFNIPYGWYKTLKNINVDLNGLKFFLSTTDFLNDQWINTVKTSTLNDFVFLDPPYTRKFQKYHPNGEFGEKEHVELAEWFKSKQSRSLIIINKDNFTNELYKDFIKEEYGKKYSIQFRDRMKEEDSNAIHILATNY